MAKPDGSNSSGPSPVVSTPAAPVSLPAANSAVTSSGTLTNSTNGKPGVVVMDMRNSNARKSVSAVVDFDEGALFPDHWSESRAFMAKVIASRNFDLFIAATITINIACTVREADVNATCQFKEDADCGTDLLTLWFMNNIILGLYALETLAKIYVLRDQWHHSAWNIFDAVIIVTGLASELFAGIIPRTSVIRVLRLVRLAKLVRFFIGFRELYLILSGFLSVAKTIIWAAILLFIALTVCSVLAVEYIHPINRKMDYGTCSWCSDAFESVMKSNVTLFQIVIIGDSWGNFAQPLIKQSPLAGLLLVSVVLLFTLGFANLIMAVIVEKAFESRADDKRFQLIVQRQEAETIKTKFTEMCKDLDDNGDGTLTLDELIDNYDTNRDFLTALRSMKIDREDLNIVFEVLDSDGSGTVAYKEFADNLYKMKSADTTTMLTFIRYNLHSMAKHLEDLHSDILDRFAAFSASAERSTAALAPLLEFERVEPVVGGARSPPWLTCNPLLASLSECLAASEPQPPILHSGGLRMEEQFFLLRDRVQARLAAVDSDAVARVERETKAMARSAQALSLLDNSLQQWAPAPLENPIVLEPSQEPTRSGDAHMSGPVHDAEYKHNDQEDFSI